MEIGVLIEQTKLKMLESGMSEAAIYNMKHGFTAIQIYFATHGQVCYDKALMDNFVLETRSLYDCGEVRKGYFCTRRKCAELVKSYYESGEVASKKLTEWRHLQNPLRQAPTQEQLDDHDNIYGLVHKACLEIQKFNLHIKHYYKYRRQYDNILLYFESCGLAVYDQGALDNYVVAVLAKAETMKNVIEYSSLARKAADYLQEYYEKGYLTRKTLPARSLKVPNSQFNDILRNYIEHCKEASLYTKHSIKQRYSMIRGFLFAAEKVGFVSFENMTLLDVKRCLMTYLAPESGLMRPIYGIKMFLLHLFEQSITDINLSLALPRKVPRKKKPHAPYTNAEIDTLLDTANNNKNVGKRDFAIMTIALVTGLRGCDILSLEFGDIDWRLNEISIVQNKTGHPMKIPLTADVGNAIIDYIKNERPESESQTIFVRSVRPFVPLSKASSIMSKYTRTIPGTCLFTQRRGIHSLRRTFGLRLLKAEIPHDIVSEMLGHKKPESSKPYFAIDAEGLKLCALPLIHSESVKEAQVKQSV